MSCNVSRRASTRLTALDPSGYGTNLEGLFPVVCKAIELCHEAVHRLGAQRIATDIRIGTRTDKPAPTASGGQTENQRKKQSVLQRLQQE